MVTHAGMRGTRLVLGLTFLKLLEVFGSVLEAGNFKDEKDMEVDIGGLMASLMAGLMVCKWMLS